MPEKLDPQLDELRRRARRRLVGAIVLALAAAVLVPMLLESDPKPLGEDVSVKIPPVDEGKFVTRLGEKAKSAPTLDSPSPQPAKETAAKEALTKEPAPKETAAKEALTKEPATKETTAKEAPADVVKDAPKDSSSAAPASSIAVAPAPATNASTTPAPAASKEPAASRTPDTKETPAAAKSSDRSDKAAKSADSSRNVQTKSAGYSVQLAAFSDDRGANALAGRLKKAGHPAYTEPYTTSRGTLYRVRVGPYSTREAAESARAKLKADGQNGIIATATN